MNPIVQAASVLLGRGPRSRELFIVRRSPALRFFGGFVAFPGGKIAAEDASIQPIPKGDTPGAVPWVRLVTAARELFEEVGVLIARTPDGSFPPSGPVLERHRRDLIAGRLTFAEILADLGVSLHEEDFEPLGNVTTPAFAPVRFDTLFFLAHQPSNQQAEVWPGELDQGFWSSPAAVLDRWTGGEDLVSPPTVAVLQALHGRPVEEVAAQLAPVFRSLGDGTIPPIYFAPQVRLIPLRTNGLPPSTHTNAYLLGNDPAYLLDPGSTEHDEQVRLFDVLDTQRASGGRLCAVVLTHHHPDHVGAAAAVAGRYGVPIRAHPLTALALRDKLPVRGDIANGQQLDLGAAPDGQGRWHLEALHTPGHASGHLSFYEPRYRLLFAGDVVSTLSSVVIAPPDGDLAVYLDSLCRLRTLDSRLLLPAHGNVSASPRQTIDECLAHRAKREQMLLAALSRAPCTVAELVVELYQGIPEEVMRFAELQVWGGLIKLRREGRVEPRQEASEERWSLTVPSFG